MKFWIPMQGNFCLFIVGLYLPFLYNENKQAMRFLYHFRHDKSSLVTPLLCISLIFFRSNPPIQLALCQGMVSWLKNTIHNPRQLQHLARVAIRQGILHVSKKEKNLVHRWKKITLFGNAVTPRFTGSWSIGNLLTTQINKKTALLNDNSWEKFQKN